MLDIEEYSQRAYEEDNRLRASSADLPELRRRLRALVSSDAVLLSDRSLVQKMIELDYTAYRKNDPSIRDVIESIARLVSEITEGFPLKFAGVGEDKSGLFPRFTTPDGEMPLNFLSQGTQSTIQWVGHLVLGYAEYYQYSRGFREKPGVVIVDEIDAHIHPSWQQRIIPTLLREFPNLQIFCSTHSPLMVAGLRAGQVHLLRRDDKGRAFVTRNRQDVIGWSSDEILRGLMEVEAPTDLETSARVEKLKELRSKETLNPREKRELEALRMLVGEQVVGTPIEDELFELRKVLGRLRKRTGGNRSRRGASSRR